jgi:sulfite exporter TauE/SafE
MLAQLAGILYGFGLGLRRGSSSCMALCVPVIIPALVEHKGEWWKGVRVALYYNAPRILILTLLGIVVGAGGYVVGASLEFLSVGSTVWALGYVVVGCMMIAYGSYIFSSTSERLDDLAEGKTECDEGPVHPVLSKLRRATPKSRTRLILWGGIVSLACVGETVIALEAMYVVIFAGAVSSSPLYGTAIGGLAFFMFALGTAFPTLLIAGFSSKLANREKRIERLLQVERISGALMMGFGAMFVLSAIFLIY